MEVLDAHSVNNELRDAIGHIVKLRDGVGLETTQRRMTLLQLVPWRQLQDEDVLPGLRNGESQRFRNVHVDLVVLKTNAPELCEITGNGRRRRARPEQVLSQCPGFNELAPADMISNGNECTCHCTLSFG